MNFLKTLQRLTSLNLKIKTLRLTVIDATQRALDLVREGGNHV